MSDLGLNNEPESIDSDPLRGKGSRLGFVTREPLDTMLRLERSPPPLLGRQAQSTANGSALLLNHNATRNIDRLAATEMNVKLAEVVLSLEAEITDCGDEAVIEGLVEVFRFLQHTQHLRTLQDA